jgi:hypothetical protein
MQLVQVDDVHGCRAAVTTFASDVSSLRFVLVPVCPVGEPAYYETVREMLRSCDPRGDRASSGQAGMGGGAAGSGLGLAVVADRPRPPHQAEHTT